MARLSGAAVEKVGLLVEQVARTYKMVDVRGRRIDGPAGVVDDPPNLGVVSRSCDFRPSESPPNDARLDLRGSGPDDWRPPARLCSRSDE